MRMAREQKTYAASWEGELILACRKCQKKLKRSHTSHALAKLKKVVKRHNNKDSDQMLHVINVPCMDLCPKDGVTICCPARDSTRLVIVRTEEDVHRLYRGTEGAEVQR